MPSIINRDVARYQVVTGHVELQCEKRKILVKSPKG